MMCLSLQKQAMKQFFKILNYTEHGSEKVFKLEFDLINIKIPDFTGWNVKQLLVTKVSNLN